MPPGKINYFITTGYSISQSLVNINLPLDRRFKLLTYIPLPFKPSALNVTQILLESKIIASFSSEQRKSLLTLGPNFE